MQFYLYPILLSPHRVQRALERIERSGLVPRVPNLWQIAQGVLRMQHRVLFRSDTVGMSTERPVRKSWLAHVLQNRALRLPFLLKEKAISPLDMSGLLSSPARIRKHLLAAHHDGREFSYDLEMLATFPGELERFAEEIRAFVADESTNAAWIRDLCVFEGYHDRLLEVTERALGGDFGLSPAEAQDPDVSFFGYLAWCARQPATPTESLRGSLLRDEEALPC